MLRQRSGFGSIPQRDCFGAILNAACTRYGGVIGKMNTEIGSQEVLVGSARGYPPYVRPHPEFSEPRLRYVCSRSSTPTTSTAATRTGRHTGSCLYSLPPLNCLLPLTFLPRLQLVSPSASWESVLPWTGGMQALNCSVIQHPSLQCAEAYAPDSQTHFRLFWLNQRMLQVGRGAAACCCI